MVGRNILRHPASLAYDFVAPGSTELDLTDTAATEYSVNHIKPDIVIHAAGRVGGIHANLENPVEFLVTNTDLGRNVIMAAYKSGVPKLINLASSCMYPRHASNPLTENLILQGELEPTNEGYALAKIFSTRLCEYINRESKKKAHFKFDYKTLIPCNLYGLYDKFDPENSHLIPAIIRKIHEAKIRGRGHVDIWGGGTARREFMYAGDLAEAVLLVLSNFGKIPMLMNVGLGHDYSINDYYTTVAEVIGWNGHFVHDHTKPVGMQQKLVDITLQREWGWMPATSLEAGIKNSYQYFLEEHSHAD